MTMAALAIAGTVISAGSAVWQGVSGAQYANYQAQVADMNRRIALDNANRAIERSQVEQVDQDMQTLAMLGEQQAEQSASGLSLGSRSFRLTRKSARDLGRLDALNVRQAGELEAYAYKTDAANFKASASAARVQGRNSLVSGFLGAGQSLVSGAMKVKDARRFSGGY